MAAPSRRKRTIAPPLLFIVLLCALNVAAARLTDVFELVSFESIKDLNNENMAVFFRSSEHDSHHLLATCERAARVLTERIPRMRFFKVDGDDSANGGQFQAAQFHAGAVYVWMTTPWSKTQRIEVSNADLTAEILVRHVLSKYTMSIDLIL
jgi:hypothetical protein